MYNYFQFNVRDVIQFVEGHKWCGCLGIIDKIETCGDDIKYLIGVPVPQNGAAYIYSMGSKCEFEYVGHAVMVMVMKHEENKEEENE